MKKAQFKRKWGGSPLLSKIGGSSSIYKGEISQDGKAIRFKIGKWKMKLNKNDFN